MRHWGWVEKSVAYKKKRVMQIWVLVKIIVKNTSKNICDIYYSFQDIFVQDTWFRKKPTFYFMNENLIYEFSNTWNFPVTFPSILKSYSEISMFIYFQFFKGNPFILLFVQQMESSILLYEIVISLLVRLVRFQY